MGRDSRQEYTLCLTRAQLTSSQLSDLINKVKFPRKLLDCVGRQVKNKIYEFEVDKHKLIFVTSWLSCRFEVLRLSDKLLTPFIE